MGALSLFFLSREANSGLSFSGAFSMSRSRRIIPSALHAELSEYSSLLRALKTSHTLDLSSHLLQLQNGPSQDSDSEREIEDEGRRSSTTEPHHLTSPSESSQSPSRSQERQASLSKRKTRDIWTRWPLLAGDVHAPEWGLEDEVKLLAIQTLKSRVDYPARIQQPHDEGESSSPPEQDIDDDALLPLEALSSLTFATSECLSRILGALVAHIPSAQRRMQNRVKPLSWRDVINIVAACGLVDETVLEKSYQRLRGIYGSDGTGVSSELFFKQTHIQSRDNKIKPMSSTAQKMMEFMTPSEEFSFLSLPAVPRKKSKRRGKRKDHREVSNSEERDAANSDYTSLKFKARKRRKLKDKRDESTSS